MASTSAPRGAATGSAASSRRMESAATNLCSDYQSLIIEIRKALGLINSLAVDLEKERQPVLVKHLENMVLELLVASEDCLLFSSAVQGAAKEYKGHGEQPTDFKKMLDAQLEKIKAEASSAPPQTRQFYRQFKEAVWNVHHEGQPMPGEEQEDVVMTSTQSVLLNMTCPLTGKPVAELESPVRCMDCKHIYSKDPVMHYIQTKKPHPQCPVAGCPKILQAERVLCDPLLLIEIDEARARSAAMIDAHEVEDFTALDDD